MTVSQTLMAALEPVGLPVEASVYTGADPAYITFNYDLIATHPADNRSLFWRALIQVHLVCPLHADYTQWRAAILTALRKAGTPCSEIVDATDDEGRHLVFETEMITKMEE